MQWPQVILLLFSFIIMKKLSLILLAGIFSLQILPTFAATKSWDFTHPSEYTVSDPRAIETNGSAYLKEGIFLGSMGVNYVNSQTHSENVALSPDENFAYLVGTQGLLIFDIADKTNPNLLTTLSVPGYSVNLLLSSDGNTVYLASQFGGLHIIDVSVPSSPVLVATYNTPDNASDIVLSNDETIVYIADRTSLQIIDVSNTSNPTLIWSGNFIVSIEKLYHLDISADNSILYLLYQGSEGLKFIDISDPYNPILTGSSISIGYPTGTSISPDGNILYASNEGNGLKIIDISDINTPTLLSQITGTYFDSQISTDGNTLYLAAFTNGISVYDVSNPTMPVLLNTIDIPSLTRGLGLSFTEQNLYVSSSDQFTIFNLPQSSIIYSKYEPFINPNKGKIFTSTLSSFTETLGTGNQGTVSYQVSTDNGTTWKYWDGSAWIITTQTDGTETSSVNDINTNIATLDTDGGQFLWRAYLNSDGTQPVELESVSIDGTFVSISLTNPITDIDVINQGWFPITTEVTCDSTDDCGDIEVTLDPIGDFFFERTETGGEEDCITDNVCITRADYDWGIHNSVSENSFNWFDSPADTEWYDGACGTDPTVHTYGNWMDVVGGGWNPDGAVGNPMCMHLITDDIYIDIEFQSWDWMGAFSYYRSTTGKGIIPTIPTQPFWTNELTNPITVNLKAGETHSETFWVYADGTVGDSFEFFTYVNPVGGGDFKQLSEKHTITLIAPVTNNLPTTISLDNNTLTELQAQGTLIGNLSTTDTDVSDVHTYSLTCINTGAHDTDFQISGSQLQVKNSLPFGVYNVCIVSYDRQGGILEQSFDIAYTVVVIQDALPESPGPGGG